MDEKKMTGLLIGMQKSLFNFAYSLTMNRDDAQDLLQATSLKVLSNCLLYTSPSPRDLT